MTNNRYLINDLMIVDEEANPVKSIYIREILDYASYEFKQSKLSKQQKIDIIDALGLDTLTNVLHECFKNKGSSYNATNEAQFTYAILSGKIDKIRPKVAPISTEK